MSASCLEVKFLVYCKWSPCFYFIHLFLILILSQLKILFVTPSSKSGQPIFVSVIKPIFNGATLWSVSPSNSINWMRGWFIKTCYWFELWVMWDPVFLKLRISLPLKKGWWKCNNQCVSCESANLKVLWSSFSVSVSQFIFILCIWVM